MARQVTLRDSGGNPKSPPLRAAVRILDVQLGKIQERTYIEVGYKDASQTLGSTTPARSYVSTLFHQWLKRTTVISVSPTSCYPFPGRADK